MSSELFEYSLYDNDIKQCLADVEGFVHSNRFHRLVTLNPQIVVGGEQNLLLKKWVQDADMILADGIGLKCASKLLHDRTLSMITGIYLVQKILELNTWVVKDY